MNNMLSKALREFTTGPLNQLIVNLGGQEGDKWEDELKKFLRKEPCWSGGQVTQVTVPKQKHLILESVSMVVIPATICKFISKDKFVCDTSCKTKYNIGYIGENFTEWFLSGKGKIEDPISEQILCYSKLCEASLDYCIIEELGGMENSETTLFEMFFLMEKQKNGEDGLLLNNGYFNIFYIRDQNGCLRSVNVDYLKDRGWFICSSSIKRPDKWGKGVRLFHRKFI